MTIYYVDSAAGSNTAPYDTWAKAATTMATIAALGAMAGNTIYVASTHNESTAAAVSFGASFGGVAPTPLFVICADKTSGAPPTTAATGGAIAVTGDNALTLTSVNGPIYFYGLTFKSGRTSAAVGIDVGSTSQGVFESCSFQLTGVSGTASISLQLGSYKNCTFKFAAAGQKISGLNGMRWQGGSLLAGGTSPTNVDLAVAGGVVQDLDLTAASAAVTLAASSDGANTVVQSLFTNIALPASWSGTFKSGVVNWQGTATLINSDSTGTNYILHRKTPFGDVYSEIVVVRSGGASDGVTPLSWKMVSIATSGVFPHSVLSTGEFVIWNDSTGSRTVTVEFLHDSLTGLKNNEIWLEVRYLSATGTPLGALASSAIATPLTTPATCTTSSATWTTTGITNVNKQIISVTFTQNLKGLLIATVKLAKASYTVYVDPLMTVT